MRRVTMLIDFGSKDTQKIWEGEFVKTWPKDLQIIARSKLRMLNNSQNLTDLKISPSNRLEKLSGKLKEYFSIRINKQWRIIFIWKDGNPSDVQITDCH